MKLKDLGTKPLVVEDLGHTDVFHINVTDKELLDRILYPEMKLNGELENYCKLISTKFLNEKLALQAVTAALTANKDKIKAWTEYRYASRIQIEHFFRNTIGEGIVKGTDFRKRYPMTGIRLILSLGYNGDNFDIVTCYPIQNSSVNSQIEQDRTVFRNQKLKRR